MAHPRTWNKLEYDPAPQTAAQRQAARRSRARVIAELGENPVTGTRLYELYPSDVKLLASVLRTRIALSAGGSDTQSEYRELLQRLEKQCA